MQPQVVITRSAVTDKEDTIVSFFGLDRHTQKKEIAEKIQSLPQSLEEITVHFLSSEKAPNLDAFFKNKPYIKALKNEKKGETHWFFLFESGKGEQFCKEIAPVKRNFPSGNWSRSNY